MHFEWDESKNDANRRKHGIDFADAASIFHSWTFSVPDLRFDYGEVRQISIGTMGDRLIVAVVHTDRAGIIRLISARPASKKERETYETALRSAIDPG